jgi:hypothetical protein
VTLGEKQRLFARLQAELDLWIYTQGYEITDGDAYRDPRLHGALGVKQGYGHPKSCHKLRLARDKNLFRDGKFLADTESHRPIGEKWKSMHPLARWGGDFPTPDGNHYSFEHEGIK